MSKPTFIVDAMLGNLAKKLRLMGFDTFYSSNIEDKKLLNIAETENRTIITKDEQLANIAKKLNIPLVAISSNNEIEQILEINKIENIGKCVINGNTSRCTACNGKLQKTEKNSVIKKIPKGVIENNNDFWICKDCNKIYWEGSHIEKLQKFVVELNERL
ncbi:MAG TPA: Mut7-C RNAse domain-containing protein [Nitrosopumilaceae archaeon]|nr:Mut7-C RNAse domain-containing protein [Nitrosopumilaceae archaeon]